jgi:hypothetical protein
MTQATIVDVEAASLSPVGAQSINRFSTRWIHTCHTSAPYIIVITFSLQAGIAVSYSTIDKVWFILLFAEGLIPWHCSFTVNPFHDT